MMNNLQEERNKKIASSYISGLSLRELGRMYGLSFERIRQILAEMKIQPHNQNYKKSQFMQNKINLDLIKEERQKRTSWKKICSMLNISFVSLTKYVDVHSFNFVSESMRFCKKCNMFDKLDNYYVTSSKKNGKSYVVYIHKSCNKRYQSDWRSNKIKNNKLVNK